MNKFAAFWKAGFNKDMVDDIMAWEGGEMSEADTIKFFQRLVDSGQAWSLQGMYGRQAEALIEAGLVHDKRGHSKYGVWVPPKK